MDRLNSEKVIIEIKDELFNSYKKYEELDSNMKK
jgi:hypothetical protein